MCVPIYMVICVAIYGHQITRRERPEDYRAAMISTANPTQVAFKPAIQVSMLKNTAG